MKSKLVTIATYGVVISSIAVTGYFYAKFVKIQNNNRILKDEVANQNSRIVSLRGKLSNPDISEEQKIKLRALENYSMSDVIALAANISFECPSHSSQKVDRCHEKESIAIAYSTKNLLLKSLAGKANYGDTITDIVYFKNPQTGRHMYSWVPKVSLTKEFIKGDIFKNSLEIAYKVLGDDKDFEDQYNHGQEYYCRPDLSTCEWHKSGVKNGRLELMGRINLDNSQDKSFFVKEESYHIYYKENYKGD